MDSYGLNKTNKILNSLSGNYFPVKSNDDRNSVGKKCYMAFTWTLTTICFISSLVIVAFIPIEIAIQHNMVCASLVIEVMVTEIYINIRLPLLRKLANKMQKLLIENATLNEAISLTFDTINEPIRFYVVFGIFGSISWNGRNFFKVFKQNQFTYTDFSIPVYFPFEPFGKKSFAFFALMQFTGTGYMVIRKYAIAVYVINIIGLLTAQYKYLRNDLADILDTDKTLSETIQERQGDENYLKGRLRTWIKHHQDVLAISQMLKDLTGLNVMMTYVNCVFSFCFLGYMMIKIPMTLPEKCGLFPYFGGNLVEVYMLCYCAQELSDSSVSVTTKAFHGKWFMRQKSTRRTFSTIIMADNIRSRLSAFGIVNLSLTTFTQIINQAYSGCLFLLNAR